MKSLPLLLLGSLGCAASPDSAPLLPTPSSPDACSAGALGWLIDDGGETTWLTPDPGAPLSLTTPGTLTLCPGTHTAALTIEAPLMLLGGGATLSGDGSMTLIHIGTGAQQVHIEDVTLTDGLATALSDAGERAGGAIYCGSPAELTLHSVLLFNNAAQLGGGGHFGGGCMVSMSESTIADNTAEHGAGLSLLGGTTTIERTDFSGNTGDSVIHASGLDVLQLLDVTLTQDDPTLAAVHILDTDALALWGVEITDQSAAGVHLARVRHTLIGESIFTDTAGAIIGHDSESLRIYGSTFSWNAALKSGGAIWSGFDEITVNRSIFEGNTAPLGDAILLSQGTLSGRELVFSDQPDEDIFLTDALTGYRPGPDFDCTTTACEAVSP
ncbi:MAG: hypothetical protein ACI8RZ_001511 [Myxococcota bacterium]|jgi:hypothetical protein